MTQHRVHRKIQGNQQTCTVCGEWKPFSAFIVDNKISFRRASICKVCKRRKSKIDYELIRDAGLCVECKQPRGEDGTGTRCRPCADIQNQRMKDLYAFYRKHEKGERSNGA